MDDLVRQSMKRAIDEYAHCVAAGMESTAHEQELRRRIAGTLLAYMKEKPDVSSNEIRNSLIDALACEVCG